MTDLRFLGDWKLWAGLPVALLLAYAAWRLYRRETRARTDALRWLLPLLRALAVFFIVLMLTGPVLHHRKIIGQLARVILFVDSSPVVNELGDVSRYWFHPTDHHPNAEMHGIYADILQKYFVDIKRKLPQVP